MEVLARTGWCDDEAEDEAGGQHSARCAAEEEPTIGFVLETG